MAKLPAEIDPAPVAQIGGHYYRVTAWDKARPQLPTVPDCSKAVWRKHNLLDDVVETTEALAGVVALDIEKEGIPANGIGNWTVADFKGVQRDEEAYKPFKLNAHKVKNHCVGVLTYDEFHALKFYTEREKASPSLLKLQAAADLKAIAQVMPWGEAFKDGAPVLSLDGALLTTAKIAAAWQSIIPAPVPKCLEKCVEAAFEVALEDRKVPLGTVEEEKAADLFAESRGVKVSGWSPTNAYVGTAIYSNTSATGAGVRDLRNDTGASRKIGQQFTTVDAFNLCALAISIHKHEAADGNLNGELTLHVADGSTVGQGANEVAYVVSAIEVPKTTSAYIHFGGTMKALAAATVYNFWVEYSGTTDASNYLSIDFNTQIATGDEYDYDGAAWNAQTGKDLKCYLCDDAIGGKGIVRADAAGSVFFAAAGPRGTAFDTTATYTVTMGATLTRDSNVTVLQGRQGDTVTGAQAYAVQGAIGAASATYRYGYEVVNAGVTVSWQGVVGGVGAGSGYIQTPMTADTSSKSCRLTFNGTAANPVVITNAGDTPNVNQRWIFSLTYGGITSGSNYLVTRCSSAYNNPIFLMVNSSAKTTQGNMLYEHWTCTHDALGNATFMGSSATMDLGITFSQLTLPYQIWLGNLSVTMAAGFFVRTPNLKIVCGALTYYGFGFGQSASQTIYFQNEGWYFDDARFSEATPTTFAVADAGTGGELDFTVANINAIAAGDLMVAYSSGGVELGRCSRAFYEAALYNKPANTFRLGGFVDDTAYNGMYCKYTRDGILFGAASGTASGTPTAPIGANLCELYSVDGTGFSCGGWERGQTLLADALLQFNGALANATVTLKLWETEGLVATLMNAVPFSFAAGTDYDLTDINGSKPSRVWLAGDAVSDGYFLELTVSHASLDGGKIQAYSALSLVDLPSIGNVLPADTLQDVQGASDKVLSYDEEETRNTLPDVSLIPTPATGGPAAWQWIGTSNVGTLNLTTWEAVRNTDPGIANVISPTAYKILNVNKVGTASSGDLDTIISTAGGNWQIGNLSVGNVRAVTFGLNSGLTGTLANLIATDTAYAALEATRNILTAAGNILETASITVAGAVITGTYHEATTAEVKAAVLFGPASGYTGTYASPVAPTVPVCVTGTQTSTTIPVTITSDTGAVNSLYYALEGASSWTLFATTLTSSGVLTITGLTAGKRYWYFCRSTTIASADSVVYGLVQLPYTDGTTPTYTEVTATAPIYTQI